MPVYVSNRDKIETVVRLVCKQQSIFLVFLPIIDGWLCVVHGLRITINNNYC